MILKQCRDVIYEDDSTVTTERFVGMIEPLICECTISFELDELEGLVIVLLTSAISHHPSLMNHSCPVCLQL